MILIINRLDIYKPMGKLQFIFLFGLLLSSALVMTAQHTNAYPDIPYQGKRVFVQKLKLGKQNKNGQSFQAILINTGKSNITQQDFKDRKVLVKSNPSVKEVLAAFEMADLYQALGAKSLKLAAGSTNEKYSGWIIQGNSHITIEQPETVDPKPTEVVEPVLEEPIAVEVPEKKEALIIPPVTKNEYAAPEEVEKAAIPDKERVVKVDEEKTADLSSSQVEPTEEVLDSLNTTPSFESSCADIQIEKISIIKKTKNSVTLSYTLINKGKGVARINAAHKGDDNLALRAHLCSSDRLSRGAITLGGSFIKVTDEQAFLKSGDTYSGELKLPLYKLTKFTPYLVLQADPYQKIIECDETNNINFINLIPATAESENSN